MPKLKRYPNPYPLLVAAALAVLSAPAQAQDPVARAPLPAICTAGTAAGGTAMGGSMKMEASNGASSAMPVDVAKAAGAPTDEAHKALMAGMDEMEADMAAGVQAKDIDVAFVCGMIPHHLGAIAMARAELKFGKDPQNRKLAEGIVAAQEREVGEMLAWLDKHAK